MKKTIVHITLALTALTSCQSQIKKEIYSENETNDLTGQEHFEVMAIDENNTIFIGGETKWMGQSSVIMKTIDNGLNWTKVYSGKGKISQLEIIEPESILAVEHYFDDNRNLTYKLLLSNNGGNNWKEIDYPGQKIGKISTRNNNWLINVDKDNREKLFMSKDHGLSWSEYTSLNRTDIIDQSSISNNSDFFYGLYRTHFHKDSTSFFGISFTSDSLITVRIPLVMSHPKIKINSEKEIELVEKIDNKLVRYFLNQDHQFKEKETYLLETEYDLVDAFFYPDKIFLLMVTQKTHFNNYELFVSSDKGKSWKSVEDFSSISFNPYQEFNGILYGYLRNKTMRIIELKK